MPLHLTQPHSLNGKGWNESSGGGHPFVTSLVALVRPVCVYICVRVCVCACVCVCVCEKVRRR
jgi:hypothetical protein